MAAKVIEIKYAVVVLDTENYGEEWLLEEFDEFSKAYELAFKEAYENRDNNLFGYWICLYVNGAEFTPICLVDDKGVIY